MQPSATTGPLALLLGLAAIGRFHIVAIAALATTVFGWVLTGSHPWFLAGLCAVDWFLVNWLNRVVDLDEDLANGVPGTGLVARYPTAFKVSGLVLFALSLVVGTFIVPVLTPLRLVFHLIGVAYNWPILPGRRRFKEMYFWKNTMSAVLFLISGFGYTLVAGPALLPDVGWATIAGLALFFFLFELSYEVVYDLRDLDGDRILGVPTYPVVHGPKTAIRIVDGLILGSALVLLAAFLGGAVPWRGAAMLVAPVVQIGVYKTMLRTGITGRDCVALTWLGAAQLAAFNVWILLELPGATLPA
jgi:4-hydroxybenzoate polyprenyltransferase